MNAPNNPALTSTDRSIGAILVDAGRLKAEDAERIFKAQKEHGLRFGDAAVSLGLISESDIQFALSRQYDYPYLQRGESHVSEAVVAAYSPFSPTVEALRALRSQLMLRWFDSDAERKALAIVSADTDDGRSWIAANLAVVFSQLGEKTLLIDGDLRKPIQHKMFGLQNQIGLSSILAGRGGPEAVQRVPDLLDLSILTAGPIPPNPQELLARPILTQLMIQFATQFDVILIDTPSGSRCADGQTLSVRASGALMITRKDRSRIGAVRTYLRKLNEASACVVGTVVNEY